MNMCFSKFLGIFLLGWYINEVFFADAIVILILLIGKNAPYKCEHILCIKLEAIIALKGFWPLDCQLESYYKYIKLY